MAVDFGAVSQIGMVVKDLDKTVKGWEKLLGRKCDRYSMTPDGRKIYRGDEEDFCARIAIFKLSNVDIEIIEPVRGESVWKDSLEKHGEGIHHIQFLCDSYDKDNAEMKVLAGDQLQEGPSVRGDGYHFSYYDTEDSLSAMVEILNSKEKF